MNNEAGFNILAIHINKYEEHVWIGLNEMMNPIPTYFLTQTTQLKDNYVFNGDPQI